MLLERHERGIHAVELPGRVAVTEVHETLRHHGTAAR